MVESIDALADSFGLARVEGGMATPLTIKGAQELICHEAIVPEWYLDSEGIGTWSVGLTKASGIDVIKYKDNPAPISECLSAFVGRLKAIYIPDVLKAFEGKALSEAQFAAAVSFHYNTGAIKRADWVKSFMAGNVAKARGEIMNWRSPASIIERRGKERDLFFDGKWSNDGTALIYAVSKPSYQPVKPVRRSIVADLAKAMA
jgi:GH24 family phage-related lysozyme (muramidase)